MLAMFPNDNGYVKTPCVLSPPLCPLTAPEPQPQCDLHSGLAAEGRFERRERGKIYCKTVSLPGVCFFFFF